MMYTVGGEHQVIGLLLIVELFIEIVYTMSLMLAPLNSP